jgi:septal ring factor EnvC (AmiA/AmiB activator)
MASGSAGDPPSGQDERREARLRSFRSEIERLRGELDALRQRERGILGELERLGGELRLREAELGEASLRLESISARIAGHDAELDRLTRAQERRRAYLAFRLREMYKRGAAGDLRRFVGGEHLESYLRGLRYVAYLSERDGKTLEAFRADMERLREERAALKEEKERLGQARSVSRRTRRELARTRDGRSALLERIQDDARQRREALAELEQASVALAGVVGERVATRESVQTMNVGKFRQLLDWPVEGPVSAEFGNVVHPRFKTAVPHPGLDIDAVEGADIRAVFDGAVAFAGWLRGYGLTVIVDHGTGLVSIYAHASALLVEEGEKVDRGQVLGKVGDTGSLRGPYLYLEIREGGEAVDPRSWLRPR